MGSERAVDGEILPAATRSAPFRTARALVRAAVAAVVAGILLGATWVPARAVAVEAGGAAGARRPSAPADGAEPRPGRAAPRTWHATAFVSGMGGYRIIHYWSEGASMRAETLVGGHPIATLVRGDRYAVVDRLTGKALEIERSPKAIAEDAGRVRPFGFELDEIRAAGGERVEETKLAGVDVEVWRVTDALGRRTVWLSRDEPRVPLRVETFVRATSQTIEIDYSGWGFDLEIPGTFYALPPGLEVERLSYEAYLAKSREGPVGPAPILYPDLLHGGRP